MGSPEKRAVGVDGSTISRAVGVHYRWQHCTGRWCEFEAAAAHVVESFRFVTCRLVHNTDVDDR